MRIIGVIDVLGGRAVHAKGGCRQSYRPVDLAAGMPVHGDAVVLARVYAEHLGLEELYVADLDAIAGGGELDEPLRVIVAGGVPVWVDSGVSTVVQARRAIDRGASRVVVGLETLPSFADLRAIANEAGPLVAFSLDLRDGRPITSNATLAGLPADDLVRHAVDAGAAAVIVLDLARVGSGRGLDLGLIEQLRRAAPDTLLLAGGGVRGGDDVRRLASAGGDGVLVATALHGVGAMDLLRAASAAGTHG